MAATREFRIKKRSVPMPEAPDQRLLEALLDSWDRNNTILLNLLRHLPVLVGYAFRWRRRLTRRRW